MSTFILQLHISIFFFVFIYVTIIIKLGGAVMNQKDKKTNDELNMKDISNSDNINYVNGKNASV